MTGKGPEDGEATPREGGWDARGDRPRTERRRDAQFGRSGRPRMTNLAEAAVVARRAAAEAEVGMSQETLSAIVDGTVARGDVLSVAELAGVMAAKRTSELIPLVHATPLTELVVTATPERAAGGVRIKAETAATAAAGVEMEALTAATVAALTLYDMIRDTDPAAEIRGVRLLSSTAAAAEWTRPAGAPGRSGWSGGPRAPRATRMAGRRGQR